MTKVSAYLVCVFVCKVYDVLSWQCGIVWGSLVTKVSILYTTAIAEHPHPAIIVKTILLKCIYRLALNHFTNDSSTISASDFEISCFLVYFPFNSFIMAKNPQVLLILPHFKQVITNIYQHVIFEILITQNVYRRNLLQTILQKWVLRHISAVLQICLCHPYTLITW